MSADPNERVAVRYQGRTVWTGRREDAERLTQDQIEGLYRLRRRTRFELFGEWAGRSVWRLAVYWIVLLGPVFAATYWATTAGLLDAYINAWHGVIFYVVQSAFVVSIWHSGNRRSKILAGILAGITLASLATDLLL